MIEVVQVIIPVTDINGDILQTKKVVAKWVCPTCGTRLGKPFLSEVELANGNWEIHLFKNECNHITRYEDLKVLERMVN